MVCFVFLMKRGFFLVVDPLCGVMNVRSVRGLDPAEGARGASKFVPSNDPCVGAIPGELDVFPDSLKDLPLADEKISSSPVVRAGDEEPSVVLIQYLYFLQQCAFVPPYDG
ncbi:unnamed protein product, partial [Scytosiphon promiscuus]